MAAPPKSCMIVGSWPSISQANKTANRTSASPMNEASFGPRARAAAVPARLGVAAAPPASPSNPTHHRSWLAPIVTSLVLAASGTTRARPNRPSVTAPTHMPPQAIATGGSGSSSSWAESTKKVARPTAASRPHATPAGLIEADPVRSSTIARPAIAAIAPAIVSGRGRWPRRSQSQPTTRIVPRYSSSMATPTGIRSTALK